MLSIFRTFAALAVSLWIVPTLRGQEGVPPSVRDALMSMRPLTCHAPISVRSQSPLTVFPQVTVFVGTCATYYGRTVTLAVASDTAGLVYLLDGEASLRFLEQRHGLLPADSVSLAASAALAARLSGAVPWNAVLQQDGPPSPDPRSKRGIWGFTGTCDVVRSPSVDRTSRHWEAWLYFATEWEVQRVKLFRLGAERIIVDSEVVCSAFHQP